jgi:tRNA(Ile)-lysidine synthase
MLLMLRWREPPPLLVVSVDHGLRPEAAAEARLVAENAARLKLPWRIMQASGPRSGNLQDWARRVRYGCLAQAAHEAGFDTIVTAHHEEDQAETFLLRLARGSGVYGLAAMREEEPLDDLVLSRPLLGVSRAALGQVVVGSGLRTVVDPSNADLRFDRVRMRALLPTLGEHGLDAARLAETAGRLARAAAAIDHYASEFLRAHFCADAFGAVSGPAEAFASVPEEVGLRALARLVKAVGGADYTPPLASVEGLRAAILAAAAGNMKRTLSGVVVAVEGGKLTARREWGRAGLADVVAQVGVALLWDGRFRVQVPQLGGALSVGALGRAEGRPRSVAAGPGALQTLPGLYQDGTLVAAPIGVLAADGGGPLDILAVECIVGQRLGISAASLPVAP